MTFFGSSYSGNISADVNLAKGSARLQELDPQSSGLAVNLPDTADFDGAEGALFYVYNTGSNSLAIKDNGGSTLETLSGDYIAIILLCDDSWVVIKKSIHIGGAV